MATHKFTNDEVTRILEQVLVHQCACPGQLCRVILNLQDLVRYEKDCVDHTATDVRVHHAIESAASQCLDIMQACLTEVLNLEGWDLETLKMPQALLEHQLNIVQNGGDN